MHKKKVTPIAQGAMIVAIMGNLTIFNTYTGSVADILIAYVMTIVMGWYAKENDIKYISSVYVASSIIVLLLGQIFFWIFSIPTMLLGVYYGIQKKKKDKASFLGLVIISAIKNCIIFFIFGGVLDTSVYQEGLEIYEWLISLLPFIKNSISIEVTFVILWIFIFMAEAYCIYAYSELLERRFFKKK